VVADPGKGARLLPWVSAEAAAVAACYGTAATAAALGDPTRRTLRGNGPAEGATGTADALGARLDGVDVAHVACHFDLDLDDPGASVLRVGAGVRLADLVDRRITGRPHLVLSACDAGLTGTRLPDEALGPAPMLLHAGARSVLAALWPADDELTVGFMAAYHAYLAAGTPPAKALSMTRRTAMGPGGHPAVWAAWSHTGP
jgi:CHAT domain-containing protein